MELCKEFEQADAEYFPDAQGPVTSTAFVCDSSSEDGSSDEDEAVSTRGDDEREEKLIDDFLTRGCGCALGPKKSLCSNLFGHSQLSVSRMNSLELSSSELDMLVLANLNAHRHSGDGHACNSRATIDYYFRGRHVCKSTFMFVHAIGPKK